MEHAYLLIGGNQGDRQTYLEKAKKAIGMHCGELTSESAVYETEAWGQTEQAPFLNQALELQTAKSPEELLACILQIETALGRRREQRYGPRTIDIDILLFGKRVVDLPFLIVPHPELANRRFALHCLNDIAPDLVHPVYKKKICEMLLESKDPLQVNKFT
jgi:2-amino-4-hydroxy-6-hydroxymethyldihydropteridine diphosphokinase